jgi:hypothetical protein
MMEIGITFDVQMDDIEVVQGRQVPGERTSKTIWTRDHSHIWAVQWMCQLDNPHPVWALLRSVLVPVLVVCGGVGVWCIQKMQDEKNLICDFVF